MNIIEAIEVVKQAQQKVYHPKYKMDDDIVIFSSVSEDGILKGNSLTLEHITPELLDGWCIYNVEEKLKDAFDAFSDLEKIVTEKRKKSTLRVRFEEIKKQLRILLEYREYGLKAILLLVKNENFVEQNFLKKIFPWLLEQPDYGINYIYTLKDWLTINYGDEIINCFLEKKYIEQISKLDE